MTDIGIPDPLEPEIEIVPAVDPVPGPVEVPEPVPARAARTRPGMTRSEPILAWRIWRLQLRPRSGTRRARARVVRLRRRMGAV